MIYEYWVPPGSVCYISNPDWTGRTATYQHLDREEVLGHAEATLFVRTFAPITSDLPLVVEWFLLHKTKLYMGTAADGLSNGIHAGRWALGGHWKECVVLTIQDRSEKQNDPGYSNRPLLSYGTGGEPMGPSQVMELGATTKHDFSDRWFLESHENDPAFGSWQYDFEWARGAAWTLLRYSENRTIVNRATFVQPWDHSL